LWIIQPNLRGIPPLARRVSQFTGLALRDIDPIVGSGMNTFSTGTPFTAPEVFQPFDPAATLGIPRRVVASHLASQKIVAELSRTLGFTLSPTEQKITRDWIKRQAYARGK